MPVSIRRCNLIVKKFVHKKSYREEVLINNKIPFDEIRLIDSEGNMVGVIATSKALAMADEAGLDLIVMSKDAKPPVCRMMDYGHYKYEKEKQAKLAKRGSKATVIKELKMSPKISENDYQVRLRAARKFLAKGYKVKVTLFFRGREMAHVDLGTEKMKKLILDVADIGVPENQPRLAGRTMHLMLSNK